MSSFRDPDFWRWMIPVLLITAVVVGFVVISAMIDRWNFDECIAVGHTPKYCTAHYWLGAHGKN